MSRPTALHARTSALNLGLHYKEWAGYAAPCSYDRHSEREYFAGRHTAVMIDVSPLYKYDIEGPDAGALMSFLWARDMGSLAVGQVGYGVMCDERGYALDDGTVTRFTETQFRMTSSEPWLHWLHRHGEGMNLTIRDVGTELAGIALQGPRSRDILRGITAFAVDKMRFFRARRTTIAGIPVELSRTGYTGDLGFEVFVAAERAGDVWDALISAGRRFGVEPAGLDALDVLRLEAGFVLQGIDYVSARAAMTDGQKSDAWETGLGWTVELDRAPFLGQAALKAKQGRSDWAMVGIELGWGSLEALYAEYGLPPRLGPVASRLAVPVYEANGGRQVGQVTSQTWSPLLKRWIAIGQVERAFSAEGTALRVEHTPEYDRRTVEARVVPRPFFDPERKRSTPGRESA